jgi:hypothetical protein
MTTKQSFIDFWFSKYNLIRMTYHFILGLITVFFIFFASSGSMITAGLAPLWVGACIEMGQFRSDIPFKDNFTGDRFRDIFVTGLPGLLVFALDLIPWAGKLICV